MAIKKEYAEALALANSKKKLQAGGTITRYMQPAGSQAPLAQVEIHPENYPGLLPGTPGGTTPAAASDDGSDKLAEDLFKADGEKGEKAAKYERYVQLKNEIDRQTAVDRDFALTNKGIAALNELKELVVIGPTELERNLKFRQKTDEIISKNNSNLTYATDGNGDSVVVMDYATKKAVQIPYSEYVKDMDNYMKQKSENPEEAKRRYSQPMSVSNLRELIMTDKGEYGVAFNHGMKSLGRNTKGMDKVIEEIQGAISKASGSQEGGKTSFTAFTNNQFLQSHGYTQEELINTPVLQTTQIRKKDNLKALGAVVDVLNNYGLSQEAKNTLRTEAVDAIIRTAANNDGFIPYKDSDGNDAKVSIGELFNNSEYHGLKEDLISGERARVIAMLGSGARTTSDIRTSNIKGALDPKTTPGAAGGAFTDFDIGPLGHTWIDFGTAMQENKDIFVAPKKPVPGGSKDKSGNISNLANAQVNYAEIVDKDSGVNINGVPVKGSAAAIEALHTVVPQGGVELSIGLEDEKGNIITQLDSEEDNKHMWEIIKKQFYGSMEDYKKEKDPEKKKAKLEKMNEEVNMRLKKHNLDQYKGKTYKIIKIFVMDQAVVDTGNDAWFGKDDRFVAPLEEAEPANEYKERYTDIVGDIEGDLKRAKVVMKIRDDLTYGDIQISDFNHMKAKTAQNIYGSGHIYAPNFGDKYHQLENFSVEQKKNGGTLLFNVGGKLLTFKELKSYGG